MMGEQEDPRWRGRAVVRWAFEGGGGDDSPPYTTFHEAIIIDGDSPRPKTNLTKLPLDSELVHRWDSGRRTPTLRRRLIAA